MNIEERLDRLINLIETSINFENPEKTLDSEKDIQIYFQELKVELFNQTEIQETAIKEKLEKLSTILEKLNKKQDSQKRFLSDFKNFLKNRKIN